MSDSPTPGDEFPLSADERRDRICDHFETELRAGRPPAIEDLLTQVPEPERERLFQDLLRIDVERRPPGPGGLDRYRARFPAYAHLIHSILLGRTGPLIPAAAPEPPAIPGYELVGPPIGVGGMGYVFRGRHVELGRLVAVKVLQGGASLERFEAEAHAASRLSHPNVVTVYDYGRAGDRPYLVMEYVEGGSLSDYLRAEARSPDWAAGLVEQVARTVHYIHGEGILHRDLKPANVLLTADGTPKVTDFGLAKRTAGGPELTATWAVLGTACYMSPEQARGETKTVGPAADVWALGGILYTCLTGRPPFRADTFEKTLAEVLSQDPVRPGDLVSGLSADLEAVCLKCLEKDPARRCASACELADDLGRVRAGLPSLARPLTAADRHARWAERAGFELGERVTETATAVTYRARQTAIGRPVWLKIPTGPVAYPTIRQEAQALAGLAHPNVTRLLDFAEQHGQPYLVLEAVDGGVLSERTPEPMGVQRAATVTLRLALGVQAVHEAGLVHGHLWPGAVALASEDVPVIVELTSAGRSDGKELPEVPRGYLAPEVRDGARPGRAADVYSLGAVLYHLVQGEPPGERLWPGLDPALDEIIRRCLEADPAERPKSAGAVQLELQLYLKEIPKEGSDSSTGSVTFVQNASPYANGTTRYCLRVDEGPRLVGRTYRLPRGRFVIGRGSECDACLREPDGKPLVSRDHCVLVWDPATGGHVIIDLESRNRTRVNGRISDRQALVAGDRIGVGPYVLVIEPLPAADATSRSVVR